MSKEEQYQEQLTALGIWNDAYKTAVKELCILERELSRARKKLKAKHTGPDKKLDEYGYFTDPLYGVVKQIQGSVLAYKDALGLTPKALRKLTGKIEDKRPSSPAATPLSLLIDKRNDRKSNPSA